MPKVSRRVDEYFTFTVLHFHLMPLHTPPSVELLSPSELNLITMYTHLTGKKSFEGRWRCSNH